MRVLWPEIPGGTGQVGPLVLAIRKDIKKIQIWTTHCPTRSRPCSGLTLHRMIPAGLRCLHSAIGDPVRLVVVDMVLDGDPKMDGKWWKMVENDRKTQGKWWLNGISWDLPSGNLFCNYGKIHHFEWEQSRTFLKNKCVTWAFPGEEQKIVWRKL